MNRLLIPLLIVLGSFLYSWFWNCSETRRPTCMAEEPMAVVEETVAPAVVEEVEPEMTEEEKLLFTPLDVYFEVAKSGINRNAEVENFLTTAKAYLEQHPDSKLSITGHSDSDGTDVTNQRLSEQRAAQVKALLIKDGFSSEQLATYGKGETEPAVPNSSPENKAKNRRVSIRLMN